MELVRHVRLEHRKGGSDKVYEVDLADVGGGDYVVNFRYGRRGSSLREGTKTKQPVGLQAAEQIFEKLVASKLSKGYELVEEDAADEEVATEQASRPGESGRAGAILARLRRGRLSAGEEGRPITRAIWRAGEMRLSEAEPILLRLLDDAASEFEQYVVVWALGQLGGPATVAALEAGLDEDTLEPDAARIAPLALQMVLPEPERESRREEILSVLPEELRELARKGPAAELEQALTGWIAQDPGGRERILETLYLLDELAHVRQLVLAWAARAEFEPPTFRVIRHLFKAAEMRRDAELFGRIARRFYLEPARWKSKGWGTGAFGKEVDLERANQRFDRRYRRDTNTSVRVSRPDRWGSRGVSREQMAAEDTEYAWGEATREYMRHRIWRTLRRIGELGHGEDYVRMCVGVLIPWTDEDTESPFTRRYNRYDWRNRRWDRTEVHYGPWASRLVLHQIMHARSERIVRTPSRKVFKWRGGYTYTDGFEGVRLEAFPEYWDAYPQALLHLIDESRCEPVHDFAARILKEHDDFCDGLDEGAVEMLLRAPYASSSQLGWTLLKRRGGSVSLGLLVACTESPARPVRAWGMGQLEARAAELVEAPEAMARLIVHARPELQELIRQILHTHTPKPLVQRRLIAQVLGLLMGLDATEEQSTRRAQAAIEILSSEALEATLADVGDTLIEGLLDHPLEVLRELAGQALLRRPVEAVQARWIEQLLTSDREESRALGMRLFGRLGDEQLLERKELLVGLLVTDREDLRELAGPIVARLAQRHPDFAARVLGIIVDVLLVEESIEGVHDELADLIIERMHEVTCEHLGLERAWELLNEAPSTAGRAIGGVYMRDAAEAGQLTVRQMVRLGDAEVLAAREAAQRMMEESGAGARRGRRGRAHRRHALGGDAAVGVCVLRGSLHPHGVDTESAGESV